jgi:transposase
MIMKMPSEPEIHQAFIRGEAAIVQLFATLGQQVFDLAEQFEKQAEALRQLTARLSKDSHNSSKPPSSDGYGKIKRTESLRPIGQRPNGGQKGHKGHTLTISESPDRTEIHEVEQCEQCHADKNDVKPQAHEERQVFDIPAIHIEVTAHHAEIKICPECGVENRGQFPNEVKQTVQYGNGVKTWASYFTNQHFIPIERTTQIFEDLIGHRISEATVLSACGKLSEQIDPAIDAVSAQLKQSTVVNFDESGLRVKGKLHWLHVASTPLLTHYDIHAKRGVEAIEDADILTEFSGTAVHDHWKPYFKYENCRHALCNAHHLRELKYIEKQYQQSWAASMSTLLLEIKATVEKTNPQVSSLPPSQLKMFEKRYDEIVKQGFDVNPREPPKVGENKKRGRTKQTPPFNLLIRLKDFKSQVLAFMYDSSVPFDNNQAERDVRMVKVKQKVSGCFRTVEGAEQFGRARAYISTARKNAVNIFDAIKNAFGGKPFIPEA